MHGSLRHAGRLVVIPLVVTGFVARALRRRRDRQHDTELWAAATDAAATVTPTGRATGSAAADAPRSGT